MTTEATPPRMPGRLVLEMRLVPAWAWMLAAAALIGVQAFFGFFARQPDGLPGWLAAVLGVAMGALVVAYVLFIGYISRDAQRRRMSAALWVLAAILIPHGLGIILYFLLRQPLARDCPRCASPVRPEFKFCAHCSYELSATCPQCQHEVGSGQLFCPSCGTSLTQRATSV